MKNTQLALVIFLLLGTLSACKPEPAAPAAEVAPPAAEPVVTPAPEPVVPATDPAATPAATDAAPTDAAEGEEDTPHSGGDKVGVGN